MSQRQVGEKAARIRTVRAGDIELFTELTGDRNPLHYDVEAASRSRFGGIIVQSGVASAHEDKRLTKPRATIIDQEGTIVLDGSALVWTEAL